MIVTVVLIALLALYMQKTRLGKAIRAAVQNREASVMMGINTNVIIAAAFAVSPAYGAVAGSFMGALFACCWPSFCFFRGIPSRLRRAALFRQAALLMFIAARPK